MGLRRRLPQSDSQEEAGLVAKENSGVPVSTQTRMHSLALGAF